LNNQTNRRDITMPGLAGDLNAAASKEN